MCGPPVRGFGGNPLKASLHRMRSTPVDASFGCCVAARDTRISSVSQSEIAIVAVHAGDRQDHCSMSARSFTAYLRTQR